MFLSRSFPFWLYLDQQSQMTSGLRSPVCSSALFHHHELCLQLQFCTRLHRCHRLCACFFRFKVVSYISSTPCFSEALQARRDSNRRRQTRRRANESDVAAAERKAKDAARQKARRAKLRSAHAVHWWNALPPINSIKQIALSWRLDPCPTCHVKVGSFLFILHTCSHAARFCLAIVASTIAVSFVAPTSLIYFLAYLHTHASGTSLSTRVHWGVFLAS
jgi:hypothetical protein